MKRLFPFATVLLFSGTVAFADSEIGKTFRKVVPAAGVQHVLVDLSIGEVRIRSGAGSEIEVAGEIRREYDGRRGRARAQEVLNDTNIEVEIRGDRAFIREKRGPMARRGSGRWRHNEVDVRITLPRGVNLEVEQNIGELDVAGDFHDVSIEMMIGELSLKLPKQNVKELTAGATIGELDARLGDRFVSREGIFAGSTHFVNEGGTGIVEVRLRIGEIDISLQ